jgi:hypothetical protein
VGDARCSACGGVAFAVDVPCRSLFHLGMALGLGFGSASSRSLVRSPGASLRATLGALGRLASRPRCGGGGLLLWPCPAGAPSRHAFMRV